MAKKKLPKPEPKETPVIETPTDHGIVIPDKDEVLRRMSRIYSEYLGDFFCEPLPKDRQKLVEDIIRTGSKQLFWQVGDYAELRQVVQCYVLSFGKRMNWLSVNAQKLIEEHFSHIPVMELYGNCAVLVIYFSGAVIKNRMMRDLIANLVDYRILQQMPTLFVTCATPTVEVKFRFNIVPIFAARALGSGPVRLDI